MGRVFRHQFSVAAFSSSGAGLLRAMNTGWSGRGSDLHSDTSDILIYYAIKDKKFLSQYAWISSTAKDTHDTRLPAKC
jgi:hypothetical protein